MPYAEAVDLIVMAEADPWREYRRRRNLSLLAFLGFVPFVFLLAQVTIRLFGTPAPAFFVGFGWMVLAGVAGNWFITFKCPRCGKPFFADSKWWGHNTTVRQCLHCKLPLNSPVGLPTDQR